MKKHPQVSITTLLYNSADGLSQCLQAIRPKVQSGFAQMLVVDNASPDGSAEFRKPSHLFIVGCVGNLIATCYSAFWYTFGVNFNRS